MPFYVSFWCQTSSSLFSLAFFQPFSAQLSGCTIPLLPEGAKGSPLDALGQPHHSFSCHRLLTAVRRGVGSRDRIERSFRESPLLSVSVPASVRTWSVVPLRPLAAVFFFRWNEDESPQPSDILLESSRVESPYQTNSAGKCTILYDKLFPLNTLQATQDISGHYAAAETTLWNRSHSLEVRLRRHQRPTRSRGHSSSDCLF